jgi:hypothetical protein
MKWMVGASYMYVHYQISPIDEECPWCHKGTSCRETYIWHTCMHGTNFNEMLETKENILSLTYIIKMNNPWNYKTIRRFN